MGELFYNELGGVAVTSIATTHNGNYNLFSNIQSQPGAYYWSATEYATNTNYAWGFNFGTGYQSGYGKTDTGYAWAVHAGDVGASVVPLPAAAWLFGSGLLGLLGVARRKTA